MKKLFLYFSVLFFTLVSNKGYTTNHDFGLFADFGYEFGLVNNDNTFVNDGHNGAASSDTLEHSSFNTIGGSIGVSYMDYFFRIGYESSNDLDLSGTVTFTTERTINKANLDVDNWSISFGKFFKINDSFRLYPQAGIGLANIEYPNLTSTDGVLLARASDSSDLSWSFGLGTDYEIVKNISSFLEYKYTNYGRVDLLGSTDNFKSDGLLIKNHGLRIGLRYNF